MSALTGLSGYLSASGLLGGSVAPVFETDWLIRGFRDSRGPAGVAIGKAGRWRMTILGLGELQQGVLIGGSPGAGKTTLLTAVQRRLPEQIGCPLIDLKGDRSLPSKLGIPPERVFGLGDRCSAAWNPLGRGNPASWRDMLMSTQEWSEPHYRQAAARFVGVVLAALQKAQGTVELDDVIELLEQPIRAKGLMRSLTDADGAVLGRTVDVIAGEASLRSGVLGLANRRRLPST